MLVWDHHQGHHDTWEIRKSQYSRYLWAEKTLSINKKIGRLNIKDNQINNVTILGFKNQSELRKIYQISNLLILPSIYETWGLVVNEAMACGIPVITTKNSGASYDLIKNNVTGYLYNLGNITDLKKKVELVLKYLSFTNKIK